MSTRQFLGTMTTGMISGYIGHLVMGEVTTVLGAIEPEAAKEQEKRVSPGISYNVAAKDLAGRAGIQLDDKQTSNVGTMLSYGSSLAGGGLYVLLRRKTSLGPVPAATIMGLTLFLGIDEGVTPLMGWSAPDTAYPAFTHIRGFLGHLSLGVSVGIVAEFLDWLMGRR